MDPPAHGQVHPTHIDHFANARTLGCAPGFYSLADLTPAGLLVLHNASTHAKEHRAEDEDVAPNGGTAAACAAFRPRHVKEPWRHSEPPADVAGSLSGGAGGDVATSATGGGDYAVDSWVEAGDIERVPPLGPTSPDVDEALSSDACVGGLRLRVDQPAPGGVYTHSRVDLMLHVVPCEAREGTREESDHGTDPEVDLCITIDEGSCQCARVGAATGSVAMLLDGIAVGTHALVAALHTPGRTQVGSAPPAIAFDVVPEGPEAAAVDAFDSSECLGSDSACTAHEASSHEAFTTPTRVAVS